MAPVPPTKINEPEKRCTKPNPGVGFKMLLTKTGIPPVTAHGEGILRSAKGQTQMQPCKQTMPVTFNHPNAIQKAHLIPAEHVSVIDEKPSIDQDHAEMNPIPQDMGNSIARQSTRQLGGTGLLDKQLPISLSSSPARTQVDNNLQDKTTLPSTVFQGSKGASPDHERKPTFYYSGEGVDVTGTDQAFLGDSVVVPWQLSHGGGVEALLKVAAWISRSSSQIGCGQNVPLHRNSTEFVTVPGTRPLGNIEQNTGGQESTEGSNPNRGDEVEALLQAAAWIWRSSSQISYGQNVSLRRNSTEVVAVSENLPLGSIEQKTGGQNSTKCNNDNVTCNSSLGKRTMQNTRASSPDPERIRFKRFCNPVHDKSVCGSGTSYGQPTGVDPFLAPGEISPENRVLAKWSAEEDDLLIRLATEFNGCEEQTFHTRLAAHFCPQRDYKQIVSRLRWMRKHHKIAAEPCPSSVSRKDSAEKETL